MYEPSESASASMWHGDSRDQAVQAGAVQILGTQPPTWVPLAQALRQPLEAARDTVAAMPLRDVTTSGGAPAAGTAVRTIAFVDSPARALAHWLVEGTAGASSDVLRAWRASARALLQRVHSDPGQCLVIDTAEAAAAPDALLRTVARSQSAAITPEQLTVRGLIQPDALSMALAQQLCAQDATGAELFEELHAASAMLVDNAVPPVADQPAPDAAVHRYRELLASEAPLRLQAEAARQESEMLLLQLHRVQEEFEHHYLHRKALEDATERFGWRGAQVLAPGSVRLLAQHNHAPHRHLHFAVEDVRSGTRAIPRLEVRLLDHLGRPGLVVFSTRSDEALAAWHATGDEAGRPFMALIPSDTQSRVLLERMGTADWQLVNHLAQSIERYLGGEGSNLGVRWQVAAARLCRQLIDLPPRLRYDRLQLSRVGSDGAAQLEVLFGRVSYGDHLLDQVRLHWKTDGRAGAVSPTLSWLRPEDQANVPLAAWPAGDDGQLAAAFSLPVGCGSGAGDKRQQWAALSAGDRALVLAVLDALPGAAERTPDAALPAGASPGALASEALDLHKEGRRAVALLRLREFVRRLARRVIGRNSPGRS